MQTKTDIPLAGRLAEIYRRRGRKVRVIELPADPAAAQQVREQARQAHPGVTLIFELSSPTTDEVPSAVGGGRASSASRRTDN